jgi:putative transposase
VADWAGHLNYLHYNPVKHGLVRCPHEWEFSSFRRFVGAGMYGEDWGCGDGDFVRAAADVEE